MIRTIIILLFSFFSLKGLAQTGINTKTPAASSVLDISATDRGVLTPQYSLTNLTDNTTPVSNAVVGSLIYNTGGTFSKGYYYWDGDKWNRMIVNNEMDQILNLQIDGIYRSPGTGVDESKQLIPAGTANNYISFDAGTNQTQYINTLGIPNPTATDITLPAGTYKVDISLDCISPTAPESGYFAGSMHLFVVEAAIVNAANVPITDIKTVTNISGYTTTSIQGYAFSFVFKLATQQAVKILLKHGSGRTTNVPTRTNQSGLVINFYKIFK